MYSSFRVFQPPDGESTLRGRSAAGVSRILWKPKGFPSLRDSLIGTSSTFFGPLVKGLSLWTGGNVGLTTSWGSIDHLMNGVAN